MKLKVKALSITLIVAITIISCSMKKRKNNSKDLNYNIDCNISSLIITLKKDSSLHRKVKDTVTDGEIEICEENLGVKLPDSYKCFIKEFGNGAYSIYNVDQPINGINDKYGSIHWATKFHSYLGDEVETDGFGKIKTQSLLCLMTENSNGGAWFWLTNEVTKDGEWPLAYLNNKKLYYKVSSFKEWLRISTESKNEVIRELDTEYRLGLG